MRSLFRSFTPNELEVPGYVVCINAGRIVLLLALLFVVFAVLRQWRAAAFCAWGFAICGVTAVAFLLIINQSVQLYNPLICVAIALASVVLTWWALKGLRQIRHLYESGARLTHDANEKKDDVESTEGEQGAGGA